MKKIALITLGCAKNLVDSEVMLGYLSQAGFKPVAEPKAADVMILNTCGFIEPAREEAEAEIRKLIRIKKKHKDKKVLVAGCYIQRSREELEKKYPEIDAWMGVGDFDKIVAAVKGDAFLESDQTFLYNDMSPRVVSTPRGWVYIKISEGCSHECSFCSIPLIKGVYRSRSVSSIVREAHDLAQLGVKEMNLISQDTTYFAHDQGRRDGLTHLLKALLKVSNTAWIRLLYGYPEEISPSLLEVMAAEKICRYLDIPFEHSHPAIIRNMKRAMDGRKALRLIERIRKQLPGVALRTTLIVGFPGEGRREFQDLRDFVREAEFDHLGVFRYSPEEGTSAFSLGDPVTKAEKERRRQQIMEIQAGISLRNNKKYLGSKMDVLIEGRLKDDSRKMIGRTRLQAPEVDGVVLLKTPHEDFSLAGSIRKVEITAADVYDLSGKIIG